MLKNSQKAALRVNMKTAYSAPLHKWTQSFEDFRQEDEMGPKPRLRRTDEGNFAVVMRSGVGKVHETCRKHEIGPMLFYRWRDEMEKSALAEVTEWIVPICSASGTTTRFRQS